MQMPAISHIHVRQMEIGDFDFVRELAAMQPNFTVPAPYVLWLLLRIRDAVCLVADHSSEGPLAYLLAVPIEGPGNALYLWQLAASETGQKRNAIETLLGEGYKIAQKLHIDTLSFSAVPNSPAFRLIRRYALRFLSRTPEATTAIPQLVCPNEKEYRLLLVSPKP
jgi:hypothetical protein